MTAVKPKKSLGQHFLTDKNIAKKIVDSLSHQGYDHVIEVGPGTGILTGFLLEKENIDVTFVEIDREAIEYLEKRFPGISSRLIGQDFLKYPLGQIHTTPVAIIGNFPYNISSQIFFRILENRHIVTEVVCMLQKEVASRIVAPPGSKTYGILSVLLQAFYKTSLLFNVGPQVFSPPPNVNSAVIRLTRTGHGPGCNEKLFFRVVKTAFNQRRKMLRNSLSELLKERGADHRLLSKRPEQLTVDEFADLTRYLEPDPD
jgi:16S rRNA (adenine1518-N6/adenine1519-N6)-dimethyltransferase